MKIETKLPIAQTGRDGAKAFEKGILSEADRLELVEKFERENDRKAVEYFRKIKL